MFSWKKFRFIVLVVCAAIVYAWRRINCDNPERRVEGFENFAYEMQPIYEEVQNPRESNAYDHLSLPTINS